MLDYFSVNPMLLIAIVVFVLCLIIGFIGDRHLKKENKIDSLINNDKNKKTNDLSEENTDENVSIEENQEKNVVENTLETQPEPVMDPVIEPSFDVNFGDTNVSINENVSNTQEPLMTNEDQEMGIPADVMNTDSPTNENIIFPEENFPQDIVNPVEVENNDTNEFLNSTDTSESNSNNFI